MGYQEAVSSVWHHTEGALSDEAAVLKEIVRYATLAPSDTTPNVGNSASEDDPSISSPT